MTNQTEFSIGNLVQIVDPDEHPSEWATFVIIHRFFNCYLLSPLDKFSLEPIWVKSNEIYLVNSNKQTTFSFSLHLNFFIL